MQTQINNIFDFIFEAEADHSPGRLSVFEKNN